MSVAIVGSGLAGFTAYQTLRRGGLAPEEIAVFGTDADPAAAWRRRAEAIRQREMRSESDGHCLATTWPGLAVRTARRRRSPAPLVASLFDRYHPSVDDFLSHVAELRERSGWERSVRRARVERVRAVDGGFELDGHGVFRHVLLALGHPGLNVPEELRDDPRVVHSYEPHDYESSVTVVGAGLAAATEWLNALAAGAEVVSVRRREPLRLPLNVPREYFSARGLAPFHRLGAGERTARLRVLLAPSYPPGRRFDEPLARAAAGGAVPRRGVGERQPPGDLRDRLRARLRGRSAARRARRRARARDGRRLDRARSRRDRAGADRRDADARARRRARAMGVPRGRHARRRPVRRPCLPPEDQRMSYTLRGRLESRLAALLPVVVAACVLALVEHRWWPVEAVGLMLGIGLALDLQVYHRLLPYQPGWAALPLGALELGVLLGCMRLAGIAAPLGQAVALFAGGWLVAQLLGHAGFPLLRLGYAEEGGELGRLGTVDGARSRRRARGRRRDRVRAAAAGRASRRGRPPGAARDHAARSARRALRVPSFAAASSSARTA